MKFLGMLLGVFACANVCVAQDAPERHDAPPGLVIVKLKRERRLEQNDVKHTSTDPDALNNGGMMPTSASPFPSYVYEYSVEIRNDLPNKIRWLSWTYSLRDPDSKQELDRQEFVTFERISPGQRKTLQGRKRISQAQLASTENRKKKNGSPFEERVEFICVAYEGGTFWHRSFMSESQCADTEKRGKSR